MNQKRRKTIIDIKEVIVDSRNKTNDILLEEEMSYDNMPENLQGSIKGEESEEAIEILEEIVELLDEAISKFEEM